MPAKVYYEKDCEAAALEGKTIAVVGYGSQGHAQAQNLRESGVSVVVAEIADSPNGKLAVEHGFEPLSAAEATKRADYIQILVPDPVQAKVYENEIKPNLTAGKVLGFSHGFAIHFKTIVPPKDVDVVMIAPKGPGHLVRSEYAKGAGVPCLVAVGQDASGEAQKRALAYGLGVGGARAGIIGTTFEEETETDLFGEQAVLCGGVAELIKAGFETLTDAGYQPEIAYFECMHEMKLIVDLFYQGGLAYMNYSVSYTAEYGGYTRGSRVVGDAARAEMKRILAEVKSGAFAKEWMDECGGGMKGLLARRAEEKAHAIEKTGRVLRRMMPWLDAKEV